MLSHLTPQTPAFIIPQNYNHKTINNYSFSINLDFTTVRNQPAYLDVGPPMSTFLLSLTSGSPLELCVFALLFLLPTASHPSFLPQCFCLSGHFSPQLCPQPIVTGSWVRPPLTLPCVLRAEYTFQLYYSASCFLLASLVPSCTPTLWLCLLFTLASHVDHFCTFR